MARATRAQLVARARFAAAVRACKRKKGRAFKSCVRAKLRRRWR